MVGVHPPRICVTGDHHSKSQKGKNVETKKYIETTTRHRFATKVVSSPTVIPLKRPSWMMHRSKVTWVGVDPWVVAPEKETGYKLMTPWAPISRHLWKMTLPPEAVKASQVLWGGALRMHLLIRQSPEICSRGQRSLPSTVTFSTAPPSPASTRHWLYPLRSSENVSSLPVCPRSVTRFRHT